MSPIRPISRHCTAPEITFMGAYSVYARQGSMCCTYHCSPVQCCCLLCSVALDPAACQCLICLYSHTTDRQSQESIKQCNIGMSLPTHTACADMKINATLTYLILCVNVVLQLLGDLPSPIPEEPSHMGTTPASPQTPRPHPSAELSLEAKAAPFLAAALHQSRIKRQLPCFPPPFPTPFLPANLCPPVNTLHCLHFSVHFLKSSESATNCSLDLGQSSLLLQHAHTVHDIVQGHSSHWQQI